MKVLVTGRGGAASWTIRGEQIGAELGAVVKANASLADMKATDVVLVVKRVPDELLHALRRSGRPWLYDIVDAYPQPLCTGWTRKQAVSWVREHLARLKPTGVIWPTARMRDDCGMSGPAIPHHYRPGIAPNPIRPALTRIGYEGRSHYLEGWHKAIARECERRGLTFLLNPTRLADVDVILAVRGGSWRGYVQDHWKSNVKLANAHGSGTPFIGIREAGYAETASGGELWVDAPEHLAGALDALELQDVRAAVHQHFLRQALPLQAAANLYREALCGLKS